MAELTDVRFTLAVPDLARSTDYYTSVLGLRIDFEAPGWSFLSRGRFRVMLGECTEATPPKELGDHSWYGYVTVSDARAVHRIPARRRRVHPASVGQAMGHAGIRHPHDRRASPDVRAGAFEPRVTPVQPRVPLESTRRQPPRIQR